MTSTQTPAFSLAPPGSTAHGQWRVNIDIRHGTVTARPGARPLSVLSALSSHHVPAAVIDLDRSIDAAPGTALLEAAARQHPGRVWAGGRLSPGSPAAARLLDAGARGIIISSGALFAGGKPSRAGLGALGTLARLTGPGRLMAAVDVAYGQVRCRGFTAGTGVTAGTAIDAIEQAGSGQVAILYTDAAAALRHAPPDWDQLARLAACHQDLPIWYAGGLASWTSIARVWQLGLGAVTGRAYLDGHLGLPLN